MDLSQIEIETERLRLESTSYKYAEDIFSEYREPITLYMNHPPPDNLEVLKERLGRRENELKSGELLSVIVLLKETGEFLGSFSMENLNQSDPELGGWLKHSAHGHRYGLEAVRALKGWADEHLSYSHLVWPCTTLNIPSQKLAEALGGKVQKTYEKKTAAGRTWSYVEYWIPRFGS